ncbi:MAG: hypothetical protein ACI945_000562 [Pseudohongiellaceae bacterium]|jgi:hypothetical protein
MAKSVKADESLDELDENPVQADFAHTVELSQNEVRDSFYKGEKG